MVTPRAGPIMEQTVYSAREPEYEDKQDETKLEDCGSVEVEVGNEVWRDGMDPSDEKKEEECYE